MKHTQRKNKQFSKGFNEWCHVALIRMADELFDTERRRSCKGCKGLTQLHLLSVTTVPLTTACAASVPQEKPCFHSQSTPHLLLLLLLLHLLLPLKPFPSLASLSLCLPLAFPQINTQARFITIHQVSLRHASLLCSLQLCRERQGDRRAGRRRGRGKQETSCDRKE